MSDKKLFCAWFYTLVCDRPEGSCESCKAFTHIDTGEGKSLMLAHKAAMIQTMRMTQKAYRKQMGDKENGTRK